VLESVYQGKIVNLVLEDGKWEIVKHAPAVAILAMKDGRMLTVRQSRRAAGLETLEAPAGLLDEGEDPVEAASRELREECHLDGDMTRLTGFYSSPGFTDEYIHLFRAENLRPGHGERDEDEDGMEVVWIEPSRLLAEVASGRLQTSGPTIVAALLAAQGALEASEG
jgi:ADP-ribose pyrophosphatase